MSYHIGRTMQITLIKAKSLREGQESGTSMLMMEIKGGFLNTWCLSTVLSEFYSVRTIFTTNDQEDNDSQAKFALLESSVDCNAFVIQTEGLLA